MTVEQVYKKAVADATRAFNDYIELCSSLQKGGSTEQAVLNALNDVIALSYRLKDAALEKEPPPIPPRKRQTKGGSSTQS